jgi:hypothetical protein
MTEPTPRPQSVTDALNAAGFGPGGTAGFHVDPEILHAVSQRLMRSAQQLVIQMQTAGDLKVPVCGPDPVSRPAADGFNAKIEPALREATAFANNLLAAGKQLANSADTYIATDREARASFRSESGMHQ